MKKRAFTFGKALVLIGATLFTLSNVAHADTLEKLQGYWAAQGLQCNVIFEKTNGEVHFAKFEGYRRQGLIIKKTSVEAQNGNCEIISHKEMSNGLAIGLSCKTEIMFDKLAVRIRLNNDNELVQFDPDLPELTTTYDRCLM